MALVGNKSDFDAEYASVELGLDGPLLEKEAEIQEADVEERSLVHPLFRESRFFDELNIRDEPLSPRSVREFAAKGKEIGADGRRSVVSADNDLRRSILSLQRSVRTVPVGKEKRSFPNAPDKTAIIETWLQTGNPAATRRGPRGGGRRDDTNPLKRERVDHRSQETGIPPRRGGSRQVAHAAGALLRDQRQDWRECRGTL